MRAVHRGRALPVLARRGDGAGRAQACAALRSFNRLRCSLAIGDRTLNQVEHTAPLPAYEGHQLQDRTLAKGMRDDFGAPTLLTEQPFQQIGGADCPAMAERETQLRDARLEVVALLEARLSSLPPATAAVASGLEAARLLRRLPGDAHHHLVTRNIANGEPLDLLSLTRTMGEDRTKVTAALQEETMLSTFPAVFPLLCWRGLWLLSCHRRSKPVGQAAKTAVTALRALIFASIDFLKSSIARS